MRTAAVACLLLLLTSLLGCGGGGGGGDGSAESGGDLTIKKYELKTLPAVDFETPDLDSGRINVPTPKGFKRGDKQQNVVIRFYVDDAAGVPRVVMNVEPSKLSIASANRDNIEALSEEMLAEMDARAKEKGLANYREPCRPILLGNNCWVRHTIGKKWKGHGIDCVVLRTVFDGRLYKLELEMMAGERKFKEYQKALYAIAGNMKFIDKSAPASVEAKPADAPAPSANE